MNVLVCVPVRNERRGLPGLFAALGRQAVEPTVGWAVRLFLDACTDGSEAVVRELARTSRFEVVAHAGPACTAPSAGRARGAAFALGLQSAGGEVDALLSTDADSAPAPDWIAAACAALAGADVAAGRITRRGGRRDAPQGRLEAYYDRLYVHRRRLDPVPWEQGPLHHFTGGANLAFRAEAYRALGGFAPHACGEDALIVDEASRAGLRVTRDARMRVETSSRRSGRAPGGLAAALQAQDAATVAADASVGHPADAAWQYERQAAARAAFDRLGRPADAERLAARLGLAPAHVAGVAAQCLNAEAFAMRIVPAPPGGVRTVGLAEAERALAGLEAAAQDEAA